MWEIFRRWWLLLRFVLSAGARPIYEEKEIEESRQVQKAWSIKLTDRTAEKQAAYKEWSKPENIQARIEQHEKDAPAVIAAGKALSKKIRESLGMPLEDPPLPHAEELPEDMRGQSESTIRAMLRHREWIYDWDAKIWRNK